MKSFIGTTTILITLLTSSTSFADFITRAAKMQPIHYQMESNQKCNEKTLTSSEVITAVNQNIRGAIEVALIKSGLNLATPLPEEIFTISSFEQAGEYDYTAVLDPALKTDDVIFKKFKHVKSLSFETEGIIIEDNSTLSLRINIKYSSRFSITKERQKPRKYDRYARLIDNTNKNNCRFTTREANHYNMTVSFTITNAKTGKTIKIPN